MAEAAGTKGGMNMTLSEVVIEGTLKPDGTLELDRKPGLPPGRVQVIRQPLTRLPEGDPFWDMMNSIRDEQKARNYVPRSAEVVEAEQREMREGWAKRQEAIERLQEESRRLCGLNCQMHCTWQPPSSPAAACS
jgi:hypothetical protein